MSVFKVGSDTIPSWCDLKKLESIETGCGETKTISRDNPNEILLVTYGTGQFRYEGGSAVVRESQFFIVPESVDTIEVSGTIRPVHVLRFSGDWGADMFGCGQFTVALDSKCQFVGDPVSYPKATSFDSHYHDYNEYWVIVEGSGTVVVGEQSMLVRQGDCIAIGAGYNHDFPLIDSKVKAAYIEISAVGERRLGHLWEHMHGPAIPFEGRG